MAVESSDPLQTIPVASPVAPVSGQMTRGQRARALAFALLRSKTFVIGSVILLFWIFDAIFWGWIVPHDPQTTDAFHASLSPSPSHWFGTDEFGRDMFSRVLAGASSVLTVAPAATALGLLGGITIGLITGYYRGLVDDVIMRIVDAVLAFPLIIIAVLVLAVLATPDSSGQVHGSSQLNVIVVIGVVFTPLIARTVRSAVLVEREREYVAAAKLLGEPAPVIMIREILPNIAGPIAVEATVRLGYAIFTSATLSFLGLGLQIPSPDWGLTISNGRQLLQTAWWIVLFPALALATLVVSLNLVADGLKEVIES